MNKKYKIGDLVKIDPKRTLFWKNSDKNCSPDFDNPVISKNSQQMLGMIVGSDFTCVYTQILSNERIFWVAEDSLSVIDV